MRARYIRASAASAAKAAGDPTKHLFTACEWLFDSECESNRTLALLHMCIGVEVRLPESKNRSDEIGVTRLLADRVAFSIGGKRATTEESAEKFVKLYDARSAIMHGRAVRLPPRDVQSSASAASISDVLHR